MKDSREHILATSLSLFLRKGFKEVTMKEIVDKTGLSKGAFYHYFSSKEQVFAEVISHFFMGMMTMDFSHCSFHSLRAFYSDVLEHTERSRERFVKLVAADKDSVFNHNFYYLIFDAMRLLPDFRDTLLQQQKEELRSWKKAIALARKNGEIRTLMTDEQVARLFVYVGDGYSMSSILSGGKTGKAKQELQLLWSGLYAAIKV